MKHFTITQKHLRFFNQKKTCHLNIIIDYLRDDVKKTLNKIHPHGGCHAFFMFFHDISNIYVLSA